MEDRLRRSGEAWLDLIGTVVGVEGDMLDMGLRLEDWKLSWSLSPDSSVRVSSRGSPTRVRGEGVGLCLNLRRLLCGGEESEAVRGLDCTVELEVDSLFSLDLLISSWR